jgi:hypothetical protein
MMLTFLTLAQARGLTPVGYESKAEGLLEKVEGKHHITEVTVRPRVTLKSDAELEPARKTMEGVEAHCFIANSINARVTLTPEFVVAPHQTENVLIWKTIWAEGARPHPPTFAARPRRGD